MTRAIGAAACSCGETKSHVISRRTTYDGTGVLLWDDGVVTGYLGFGLPGVTMVRPRTPEAVEYARRAGWMLMGEVSIVDLADVGEVYDRCRKAAAKGVALREMPKPTPAGPTPVWTVVSSDRDGVPTERQWRLPRLFWAGLAVIDHCTGTNGSRNGRAMGGRNGCRYELVYVKRGDGVAQATGIFFKTIEEMQTYLNANKVT